MAKKTAPYGTWLSPITADAITQDSIYIADVLVDPVTSVVYHIEERSSEGGRSVLVNTREGQDVFGREWNARTGVEEYGGAPVVAHAGVVYFSHFVDNRVYQVKDGADPEPITPENKNHRFADFAVHPKYTSLLVAILEDHTHPLPADVVTTLCIIDADTKTVSPLVSGADFYASPRFSPDGGHLTWQQWFHPDMPWEGAEIYVAGVSADGRLSLTNPTYVAGKKRDVSVAYPFWASDTSLIFTSDESGYHNPWKYDVSADIADAVFASVLEEDFSEPAWWLGQQYGAALDAESVLYAALREGRSVLYLIDLQSGGLKEVECPYVTVQYVRRLGRDQVVFVGGKSTERPSVVLCTVLPPSSKVTFTTLKSGAAAGDAAFPSAIISSPKPMTLKVPPNDEVLHVVFYAPTNPEYGGSSIEGEKPPCVLNVHGGPTGMGGQGLRWQKQYFTSRGFAWLDVNYGGSSGYGRKYIDRLVGKWGVVDIEDCVHASKQLASATLSLIDPARIVITGQSSGGFTVLASLCTFPSAFAAGTSSSGISDLRKLGEDTHKFESRYLEKLVGGTPEEVPEVYKDRSPVFHADKITSPLLILQGSIDAVVPPAQAEAIVDSIRKRGGKVEYILFDGEGHGWRKAENIKTALEKELEFYKGVFKLEKT